MIIACFGELGKATTPASTYNIMMQYKFRYRKANI